jgi:hypothetical protein
VLILCIHSCSTKAVSCLPAFWLIFAWIIHPAHSSRSLDHLFPLDVQMQCNNYEAPHCTFSFTARLLCNFNTYSLCSPFLCIVRVHV